jgi:hypothetical protein
MSGIGFSEHATGVGTRVAILIKIRVTSAGANEMASKGRVTRVLVYGLALGGFVRAQPPAAEPPPMVEKTEQNVEAPCLEPPALVGWEDYRGPFQKVVGTFARKLERKSAHQPHYKAGAMLCSLELKDKFFLFVQDTFDPVSFLGAGFNAGIDQAGNQDPTFGQGAIGYSKRFGANFVGQASLRFFTEFAYPTIFAEDPRYYRLAHGSNGKRFLHAVEHSFVAHRDNGKHIFNLTEWLGTTSGVLVSSQLHPGNQRGFGPVAQQVGYSVMADMGFDVLREFWPEIARKFKMPFRDRSEPPPPR